MSSARFLGDYQTQSSGSRRCPSFNCSNSSGSSLRRYLKKYALSYSWSAFSLCSARRSGRTRSAETLVDALHIGVAAAQATTAGWSQWRRARRQLAQWPAPWRQRHTDRLRSLLALLVAPDHEERCPLRPFTQSSTNLVTRPRKVTRPATSRRRELRRSRHRSISCVSSALTCRRLPLTHASIGSGTP